MNNPAPMTLTLPMPPNIGNQRKHWRAKLRQKKEYWAQLSSLRHMGLIAPPAATMPFERTRIRVTLYLHNWMDEDNAMARLKWVLDWLVAWDYLAEDRRTALEWEGLPSQFIDRADPRLVVELAEVPRL